MAELAIEIDAVAKRFGDHDALRSVTLQVPPGSVLGYLGSNGAGKTTTIRVLVGQLRPTSGTARVAGLDCWRDRTEVHRRIGYLPGDFVADLDRTAAQYLGFLARLRGIDPTTAAPLVDRFELAVHRRIGELSHGNRQKVGLVQAFMGDPEVVILDEPTSGLDPLMQREFVDVVREVRDQGRTVFLSSHILDEIDAAADHVAVLRAGEVVLTDSVDALRANARRHLSVTLLDRPPSGLLDHVPGVAEANVDGRDLSVVVDGSMAELFSRLVPLGIDKVVSDSEDLEDLFAAYEAPR